MTWTEEDLYYLEKIPNISLLKISYYANNRIKHEMISIQKCIDQSIKCDRGIKFKNIDPIFVDFLINAKNKITFNLLFKYKYTINFQIILHSDYPFKPPECKILNAEYNGDYKILLARISEHYYGQNNMPVKSTEKCLCCNTVLCRNNWHPVTKLSCLLEEINTNTTYMYDIVYKMLENKIYDKYLGYQLL